MPPFLCKIGFFGVFVSIVIRVGVLLWGGGGFEGFFLFLFYFFSFLPKGLYTMIYIIIFKNTKVFKKPK